MGNGPAVVRRAQVEDAAVVAALLDDFNREYDTPTPGVEVLTSRLRLLLRSVARQKRRRPHQGRRQNLPLQAPLDDLALTCIPSASGPDSTAPRRWLQNGAEQGS